MAKVQRSKTFVVGEENGYWWETVTVACLYTYITNQHGHRFMRKHSW